MGEHDRRLTCFEHEYEMDHWACWTVDCFRSDHLVIADGVPEPRRRDPAPGLWRYTPLRYIEFLQIDVCQSGFLPSALEIPLPGSFPSVSLRERNDFNQVTFSFFICFVQNGDWSPASPDIDLNVFLCLRSFFFSVRQFHSQSSIINLMIAGVRFLFTGIVHSLICYFFKYV